MYTTSNGIPHPTFMSTNIDHSHHTRTTINLSLECCFVNWLSYDVNDQYWLTWMSCQCGMGNAIRSCFVNWLLYDVNDQYWLTWMSYVNDGSCCVWYHLCSSAVQRSWRSVDKVEVQAWTVLAYHAAAHMHKRQSRGWIWSCDPIGNMFSTYKT